MTELGISKNSDYPTYKNTNFDKEEMSANHKISLKIPNGIIRSPNDKQYNDQKTKK